MVTRAETVPPDHAQRMTRGLEVFQKSVRGLLTEHCVKCHGGEKTKGDLDLVTREGLLKGGEDGVMVVPFKAAESKLMKMIRHEEEPYMPEKSRVCPTTPSRKLASGSTTERLTTSRSSRAASPRAIALW